MTKMSVSKEATMSEAQAGGVALGLPVGDSVSSGGNLAFDKSVLEAIPALVAQIDANGSIVAVNQSWQTLANADGGLLAGAMPGADYLAIFSKPGVMESVARATVADALAAILAGRKRTASFVYSCFVGVAQRWSRVHLSGVDSTGQPGVLAMHFDVTHDVLVERELFELAYFDRLTGLPNRQLFLDRLGSSLALAKRHSTRCAVIYFDVDNFKSTNDLLGRDAGDELLRLLSGRMSGMLRQADSAGHLGSDEFAIIVSDLSSDTGAAVVARKLVTELERPLNVAGQEVLVTISMGISTYPDDADTAETLLHKAETANLRAKQAGRNCYQFYAGSMNQGVMERLRLEADLRLALVRNEFQLFYQPKVSCANGEIVGTEALLRWRHPVRGLVAPGEFIPLLEESGLIKSVGRWVLRDACQQAKRWIDLGLGTPTVAVNISANQFEDNELADSVRDALAESGLPANRLELELTESVLMRNVERVIATLSELRQLGVRFSVDDFGTGYSSLSYLKRFPIDAVKVDRSFVQDITANPDDASITRAVITMAHNLNLKVVAEGVETEGQLSLLIANHCDQIQGYFFSRPVEAAEMEKILADRCRIPSLPIQPEKRARTILLVDDEENILSSLRRLLRRDGYQILTAGGGAEALELLAQNEVDVIVSDQRMPNMTGVEFLRRVKTIHPQTVRMVLSGYTELQSITDAINEGAVYKFLTKPWEDEMLRANIEEAFRYKGLADENRRLNSEIHVANKELAKANAKLLGALAEKDKRIERDETTLYVAQEILQCVPFPVLGFDDEGVVVFANQAADQVLGGGGLLLGAELADTLPGELLELVQGGDGGTLTWHSATAVWQAEYRLLGGLSEASGRLLILLPLARESSR
jgi:diguanylate cyclase (GGDEF)-like protein